MLYGTDLLQHKNTSCHSTSWEGLLDILRLKFNPSFHKKERGLDARNITQYRMHLRHLQFPTGPLQPSFKKAYFWNFTIPVVPCFYISHWIRFSWHWSRGNSELHEGLSAQSAHVYPDYTQCFCSTADLQWPITELQVPAGRWDGNDGYVHLCVCTVHACVAVCMSVLCM